MRGNTVFGDFMIKKSYGKQIANRSVLCFFIIIMLLLSCAVRVAVVATGNYRQIQTEQSIYKIDVARLRGTIYDCNMVPLTNNKKQIVAAVSPTPKAIMQISGKLEDELLQGVLDTLKKNQPAICSVDENIEGEGIATAEIYVRDSSNFIARHLIGYTDDTGHGITGLEKAYDEILYSDKKTTAIFVSNGKGDILKGIEPFFDNDLSIVNNGVVTTIDVNIQNITEAAASKLNSGCVIVAEAGNGKMRAMASVPSYDIDNISESLADIKSPLINRAMWTYNVGSVFKPCVAAAALDNNFGYYSFNCAGSVEIGDRIFRCHNLSGHGNMDLCSSLAHSCNCYFYDFAIKIGGNSIYKTAAALSIASKIKIADNMHTVAGNIPKSDALNNEGTLANLSIGQGNLMASPVAMLNLYLAIAGDGSYYLPSVVEKTLIDGVQNNYDTGKPTRVMKSETAETLRQYLQKVVTEGTGTDALPKYSTAAGKTGTAQTGRYYDDGSEITNSWFCGFFPADKPQYVMVVMSDSKLNVSTASVFAQIADEIAVLKGINVENDG